jgi:hypothetical protein
MDSTGERQGMTDKSLPNKAYFIVMFVPWICALILTGLVVLNVTYTPERVEQSSGEPVLIQTETGNIFVCPSLQAYKEDKCKEFSEVFPRMKGKE